MGFFDDAKNVRDYMAMADGYDGRELVEKLQSYVEPGASVLELGMGPGKDLDLLSKHYTVTGSDTSTVFLDLYREQHPDADLMLLDAVTIETARSFSCLYSNKVLHHLTSAELKASLIRQAQILEPGGIALHSFWKGDGEEVIQGMRFTYYQPEELEAAGGELFDTLECSIYKEMDEDDSICLVLKKI